MAHWESGDSGSAWCLHHMSALRSEAAPGSHPRRPLANRMTLLYRQDLPFVLTPDPRRLPLSQLLLPKLRVEIGIGSRSVSHVKPSSLKALPFGNNAEGKRHGRGASLQLNHVEAREPPLHIYAPAVSSKLHEHLH
jgi:hypothetical protein